MRISEQAKTRQICHVEPWPSAPQTWCACGPVTGGRNTPPSWGPGSGVVGLFACVWATCGVRPSVCGINYLGPMAFPFEHYLLSFGGPLGSTEQWSSGLRVSAGFGTANTVAAEEAALAQAQAFISTHFQAGTSPISGDAKVAWVKYNRISVLGRYVRDTTNEHVYALPVGLSTVGTHPLQISLVATLTTSVERGLASKGRMFLPAPKELASGSNRTMSAAGAQQAATWVAGLISGINGLSDLGDVIIASAVREGKSRLVTGVNVGNVFDTMRSRRAQLTETRSSAAVTSSGVGGDF